MRKLQRILIFLVTTILLSHNCFAGKAIITRPTPFYAPESPFYDEDGKKRYLEEFENNTVLLVFWATWCGTCVGEMNSLDTLAKDFRRLPFKILAVSQDLQGITTIRDFYNNNEIRHLEAYHDYRNELFRDMDVVGLPSAFLINQNNKVVISFKGEIKWHDEKIREMILNEIPGTPEVPKNTYKEPAVSFNIMKKIEDRAAIANIEKENTEQQDNKAQNSDDKTSKEPKHNDRAKTVN